MKRRTIGAVRAGRWLALLALVTSAAGRGAAQEPSAVPDSAITAAERAAHAWFALLADANYGASWEQADSFFRTHVSREQWTVNAERLDRQFRRVDARKLIEARWLRDEPPLPRAEYVVLRWLTDLGEGRQVGERVIMARASDGAWRPATYDLYPNVDGDPLLLTSPGAKSPVPSAPRPTVVAPRRPPR